MAPPPITFRMDQAYPDSFNPVGYPCQSSSNIAEYDGRQEFTDPQTGNKIKSLRMQAGARGVIKAVNVAKSYFYVHITPHDSLNDKVGGDIGWVPGNWLRCGTQRKHRDRIVIREGVPLARLNSTLRWNFDVNGLDPITAVLSKAFQGMWEARFLLTFIPDDNWKHFREIGGPMGMAKAIVAGIQLAAPGYVALLNSGTEYTHRDALITGRDFVAADVGRVVVYTRQYSDWQGKPNKRPGQYWGYTEQGAGRNQSQAAALAGNTDTTYHVRYARGARRQRVKVMCQFTDKRLQPWAEQALISINRAQADFCKNADTSSILLSALSLDEVAEAPDSEVVRAAAADKKIQARLLMEIFDKAVTQVPAFRGGAYGSSSYGVTGLNHDSPINAFELSYKNFVTRTRTKNSTVFRTHTHPPVSYQTMNNWMMSVIHGGVTTNTNFIINAESDPKPPAGAQVACVIEIMDNEQQHEVPWARLPTVGIYRNWAAINSIGIRAEWKQGGDFKSMPMQTQVSYGYESPDNSTTAGVGSQHGYVVGDGIRRYLQQERVSNLPDWARDYGLARILDVSYDHLTQTTTMKEIFPPDTSITLPQNFRLTAQEIEDALVNAGFDRARIGSGKHGMLDTNRRSCDKCWLLAGGDTSTTGRSATKATHSAYHPTCDKNTTCENCPVTGLPCTFTNTSVLRNSTALKDAITWLLPHRKAVHKLFRWVENTIDPAILEGM